MKSLLSPTKLSSLAYSHLSYTTLFALFSLKSKPISRNSLTLFQNPNVLHQKSIVSFSHISACSAQIRGLKMEAASRMPSDESPMFAGKSTNLLRRIQSEKNNGRFGPVLRFYYSVSCFCVVEVLKFMLFYISHSFLFVD